MSNYLVTKHGQRRRRARRDRASRARRPARRSVGGFTLIELLLVMVILAILAVVVVPKFSGRSQQAKIAAAKTDIANLGVAIDSFEVDCTRYPTNEEGLSALVSEPSDLDNWMGPYLKRKVPKDPWGHPYVYRLPGQHNVHGYDLYSFGPDGAEGGGDDIVNWDTD
jgi:general secretion pathway protein G